MDTHALLWFVFDDPRLSDKAAALIEQPDVEKNFSIASVWEIVIKEQLGKLCLGMPVDEFVHEYIEKRDLNVIDITLPHLITYSALPLAHRDPFDRLLVSQAQTIKIPIVTADKQLSRYSVELVW